MNLFCAWDVYEIRAMKHLFPMAAENGLGDKVAFYWEGNDPNDVDSVTFFDLKRRVCQLANALKARGVRKGDRVAVYMPMILELPISLLACARIGAIHSGMSSLTRGLSNLHELYVAQ